MCDGGGLGAPASCEFLQLRVFGRAVALQPQWFVRIAWLDLVGLDRFASQLGIQRSVCSTSVVICLAGTSKVLPWSLAVVLGRQGFVEVSGTPLASRRRDGRRRAADAHMVRRCSSVLVAACADHSAPSRWCHSSCLSRHRPRNACGSLGSSWQRRSASTSQVRGSASVTAPACGVQQGSGNGMGAQSALATAFVEWQPLGPIPPASSAAPTARMSL